MAKHLGIPTAQFTRQYCQRTDGFFHLIEDPQNTDCLFLKNKKCGIYEARPTQCRTWPFWPDTMSPKAWKEDVVKFCPGVGKGPTVSPESISRQLQEQEDSEKALDQEAREFLLRN